jgi:hypothetical protein
MSVLWSIINFKIHPIMLKENRIKIDCFSSEEFRPPILALNFLLPEEIYLSVLPDSKLRPRTYTIAQRHGRTLEAQRIHWRYAKSAY